jgi:hypothetical protein
MTYPKICRRRLPLLLIALNCTLALPACQQERPKEQAKEQATVKNWMQEPFTKSSQVLLTNGAAFKDGQRLEGASAFLIEAHGQRYAVTAKHLIGEDGGIEPRKQASLLNSEIQAWKLFSRSKATDTITIDKLLNTVDTDSSDALVFSIKGSATGYQALTPRYEAPEDGETVYLIGCPYSEPGCTQNRYPVEVAETSADRYFLKENKEPELSGFSGCPVVDKNGLVIGLLSSSVSTENGEVYTVITPIKVVESYLKK